MDYTARLHSLQLTVDHLQFDTLLVTHPPNLRYLCGFTGSAGALLVSAGGSVFFTDGRYTQQAHDEVRGAKIAIARKAPQTAAAEWLGRQRPGRRTKRSRSIGIEGEHLTVAAIRRLADLLPGHMRLREAPPLVEQARMVKEAEEIEAIRAAVTTGAGLFDRALEVMRPGISEVEIAAEMEYAARKAGAEGMSFETIIASGVRSALPHGRASAAPIQPGGFVVCDFGVILHGYCSDRTRTVWIGPASAEARRVYDAVLEAQQAAIAAVRSGVKAGQVDRSARKMLQKNGLAKYFTHSTGHGVGLEVHEAPRVAKGQQEVLRPGMVITIEPGVYLQGQWGVRIEDMVVVTEHGCEVLTPTQKEFIVI
ncbi:MAG TPA: Xaa-Pro peptidase family protein [Terriglobales bacterium]|nr:Xaa-Pro peptidase family protein [Terriglobales bacterium]